MSLLTPVALGLGLLAIPIIIMYMLRLRRREVTISSTLLWQQVVRDQEANAPWQKLKRNLLLLLQLLILAALVIALARPFLKVQTVTTGRVAVLIDCSASMNATDVQPTRLSQAKQEALKLINTLNQNDELALIQVTDAPQALETYTNDRFRLQTALNQIKASNGPADWNAALTLATAGATNAEKFTIIVISDGGLPADLTPSYGEVKFIPIGTSDQNTAITALAAATDPKAGPQIYARLTNYGSQVASVILSVYLDDKLFKAYPYTINAHNDVNVMVEGLPQEFQRIRAEITRPASSVVPDFLEEDNVAWATYNPVKQGRAVLMSKGNTFLEQGLASLTNWQVFRGNLSSGLPTDPYDLYIFDGWLPSTLPNANLLIINPPSNSSLFTIDGVTDQTRITNIQSNDERLRYVRFDNINIRRFSRLSNIDWADILVQAQGGPVLLAGMPQNQRVAILPFALSDSDLPLRIAWPILLANLSAWYRTPRAINTTTSLVPGQTMMLQAPTNATTIRVIRPDDSITNLPVDRPELVYADTPVIGIYTVELYSGSTLFQQESFAVNMFNPQDSDITPQTPMFGTTPLQVASNSEEGQQEFWPWVALVALAFLMLEWWIYQRRQRPTMSFKVQPERNFARRAK